MLNPGQLGIVHMYAGYARTGEALFREILKTHAGVTSTKQLTQATFEQIMAVLETILEQRIMAGSIPDPRANPKAKCQNLHYWRDRLPPTGMASSRQRHQIQQLWVLLQDYLPPEQRADAYLAGIAQQATGTLSATILHEGRINWLALTSSNSGLLIEALKDILRRSVK